MNKCKLFLLRGLPGAGKSTIGGMIADVCFGADDYFETEDGYKFDPSQLKAAHESCRLNVEASMKEMCDSIAVTNTFTQRWEIEPYLELALEYGYEVHSLIVENLRGKSVDWNVHNVPEDSIKKMKDRFEVNLG